MANESVTFDGSNDFATGGNILSHECSTPFSFAFWTKITDRFNFILSKRDNTANSRGYSMYITSSGLLEVCLCNTSGSSEILVYSDTVVYTANWRHIVVSYTGSGLASGVSIVIDGVQDTTSVGSDTLGTNTIVNAAEFNLSGRTNGDSGAFEGSLYEVGAYNKALSLVEAQEVYNSGVPEDLQTLSTSADLTSYWKMGNGDTFPTLADNAGSNDLTMTNMAADNIVFDSPYMNLPRVPIFNNDLSVGFSQTTYYYRAWNTNTNDWEFWNVTGNPDPNPPSGDPNTGVSLIGIEES